MTVPGTPSLESNIRVDAAFKTHTGQKRTNNEDFVALYEPIDPKELQNSGCLYIVADGVGGASRGEKASKFAAEKVMYEYYQHPEIAPEDRLRVIIQKVGNEIFDYTNQAGLGQMATTLVAAVIREDHLIIANVGDSRAYLIQNGVSRQITRDHNQLSEFLRIGAITVEEGRKSKTGNILTRSIGGHENVDVDIFLESQLFPGDTLVLCSDGLHKYLDDVDIVSLMSDGSPSENTDRLVDFANRSGGNDNITALVVQIKSAQEDAVHLHPIIGQLTPPDALDTMQTEPPFSRKKKNRHSRFHPQMLWFLMPIFMLAFTLWYFREPILSTLALSAIKKTPLTVETTKNSTPQPQDTPSISPVFTEIANTTSLAIREDIQPTPILTLTLIPAATNTIIPSITTTSNSGYCVHLPESGQGITHILNLYGIDYIADKTYVAYQTCDSVSGFCSGKRDISPDSHNTLGASEFLLIDTIKDKGLCTSQDGLWVNSIE